MKKNLLFVTLLLCAFAGNSIDRVSQMPCVFADDTVQVTAVDKVSAKVETLRNPFVQRESVDSAASSACYAVSQDEKVVVHVYVSPAGGDLSRQEQGPARYYGVRAPDKIAALERILEKEKNLRNKMINEIDLLMKERNDLETEVAKQEAFVMELQNKRDEVKKALRLLEERQD